MYSSRGSNPYGQQQQQQQQQPSYASQSAYGQKMGSAYPGSSVGGPDGASKLSMAHSSMLGGPQETEISGYRAHSSAGAHYGGQYSSVYGSAALSSAQQAPSMSGKVAGSSALEGRSGFGSAMPDSPKFGGYVSSSSHGFGHKGDQLFSEKISDYPSLDRRQYGDRQSNYMGRDLPSEPQGRYADSISFGQHKSDMYDRMDQALLLRQEQLKKAQSLQSASLEGGSRQADYLAARGATIRHPAQDLMSYGGRVDPDASSLSMLSGGSSYAVQHTPSILGAAPRRNTDDLLYAQSSSNPGYGVSLPPGRDYATGKGLHVSSLESDYPGSMLSRGGHTRIDDRKDDRVGYSRELERREDERRREHLRDREKDREREKERERERERERDRKRALERERDRDRDRKRGLEIRRERTPPRLSKDRRGSSLTKDTRSSRRDSPRHEASHRRHSPVKEKRREYVCKIHSSSLVNVERDYLSMDKRYPRLFVSPECSKVVVNWPRENLNLSVYTPVSFEHDFIDEETAAEQKESLAKMSAGEDVKTECGITVWNAKMILMSGLSQNSLEELSSERSYDDRIPHFCNMLRFAILKKDHSFMAIGGPWDIVDGGDPSVDDSSLIRTALRYAKGITQLDLKNCQHWNRFLEIHYDRVGKNGLFSHKEVTVVYVPDLSECLPSLETWRDQWLMHKKAIAERERTHTSKKKKDGEKKEGLTDKEADSVKDPKRVDKPAKKKEPASLENKADLSKKEKDGKELKGNAGNKDGSEKENKIEKNAEGNIVVKTEPEETAGVQKAGIAKPGKKKVIKKIIKLKVANKKDGSENQTKQNETEENNETAEITAKQGELSANPPTGVKTFVRKKVVKKVPVAKTPLKEDGSVQPEVKTEKTEKQTEKQTECSEEKPKGKSGVKATIKKKIVKRVPKKKLTGAMANKDEKKVVQTGNESKTTGEQTVDTNKPESEVKSEKDVMPKTKSTATPEKQDDVGKTRKTVNRVEKDKKNEKSADEKGSPVSKMKIEAKKQKDSPKDGHKKPKDEKEKKDKDGKEKKDRDGKDESKGKANKEVKERKRSEELPRHPGLLLQTKGSKDSKLRSLSLSLDSLLDYTDKDVEDSTFELSLFAESLYEMLQYQMGCRLLTFLQKLRIKFVMERNQKKRQREENPRKEGEKKSSAKRLKKDDGTGESTKVKAEDGADKDDGKIVVKEGTSFEVENVKPEDESDEVENVNPEDETDEEEDPEEDPEEDEDMPDASPHNAPSQDENARGEKSDTDVKSEEVVGKEKGEPQETGKENSETKPNLDKESNEKVAETEEKDKEKKESLGAVDKELLQAFRFFDRNRVGYIRVEDMRLIIHNLGKFLPHRDVRELVQSALLESNTGRDDRILYNKLVRIFDI